jgi:hypothetical protein
MLTKAPEIAAPILASVKVVGGAGVEVVVEVMLEGLPHLK